MGVVSLKRINPAHAPETADGPAVAAPLASGFAAYGGLAQMFTPPPPPILAFSGQRVVITSRRTSPWPADHPPGRPGPERPHRPHQPHSCRLHRPGAGDVSARNAASVSGAARVGETLPTGIPEFAHTHPLRHAAFTRRCIPHDGAADAGIPDATGATCSRSDEDGGAVHQCAGPLPRPPRSPGDPCRRPACVSHGAAPSAAGPAGGSRVPGPQRYLAAARSWRPGSGPAKPGAIAPSPIQEGERKLPGNAQGLPLFRRAALM